MRRARSTAALAAVATAVRAAASGISPAVVLAMSLAVAPLGAMKDAAAASCAYLKVSASGAGVAPGAAAEIYGPFTISCLGTASFTFEDLSGNQPSNVLSHIIERQQGDEWVAVSQTTSRGARMLVHSFFPGETGRYRYRILNTGEGAVRTWRVHGSVPSAKISRKHP